MHGLPAALGGELEVGVDGGLVIGAESVERALQFLYHVGHADRADVLGEGGGFGGADQDADQLALLVEYAAATHAPGGGAFDDHLDQRGVGTVALFIANRMKGGDGVVGFLVVEDPAGAGGESAGEARGAGVAQNDHDVTGIDRGERVGGRGGVGGVVQRRGLVNERAGGFGGWAGIEFLGIEDAQVEIVNWQETPQVVGVLVGGDGRVIEEEHRRISVVQSAALRFDERDAGHADLSGRVVEGLRYVRPVGAKESDVERVDG